MGVQNRKTRIAWKLRFETWSTWSEEILNSGQFCWYEFLLLNHSSTTSGCLNGIVGLSWDRVAWVLVAWARARVYTRAWQLSSPAGRRGVGGGGTWEIWDKYGPGLRHRHHCRHRLCFLTWKHGWKQDWTKYWQTCHLSWIKHSGNANWNKTSHGVIHFWFPVFP